MFREEVIDIEFIEEEIRYSKLTDGEAKSKVEKVLDHLNVNVYASGKIKTKVMIEKIFQFCELYSGIEFFPYQEQFSKRVIRSVLENDGAELTALFSRQSGKSETIATTVGGMMIILPKLANMPMFKGDKRFEMYSDGMWTGIFAPGQRQAKVTFNRMKSRLQCKRAIAVLRDKDFKLEFSTSNGQTVALTNGSYATAISASDTSNIEGESFKFIICEEAQDISDFKVRKSIHPMGSAYNSTIVKVGTPTTHKGDFYEAIHRNKRDYNDNHIAYKNHFEYDWEIAAKYNDKYRKYVNKEKRRLGENSDEFRMSYCLDWVLERGMFIKLGSFERRNGLKSAERRSKGKQKKYTAGIDLAKSADSTVVTIVEVDWENPVIIEGEDERGDAGYTAYETVIVDWREVNHDNYNVQFDEIISYLHQFNIGRIVIDSTAEGSFADRLQANVDCEVVPYKFTRKSKSELYKHLDSEIKSGRAKYPSSENTQETREYELFLQQMADLRKEYKGQYLTVSHPSKRGARDDYPDSWALAVWASKVEADSYEIEVGNENPFFSKNDKKVNKVYRSRNSITARRR